jgi:predicted DNA-binding protein (UPF0251 family)
MPAKKAKKKGRPVKSGRSSGCTPEKIATIKKLAAHGFLQGEIADILGMSRMTLWRWCAAKPEVAAALSIGHEAAGQRVELSIYQQAIGYEREEEEIKVINGQVERIQVRKFYPPSATAAALWARYKLGWGEDAPPPPPQDETTTVEVRQVARQVARLLHLANKETQQ